MLRIRRTIKRKTVKRETQTRGPFLTESQERDAGWRQIVIILHPGHMILRHLRGQRLYLLTYEKAIDFARREHHKELRAIKARK